MSKFKTSSPKSKETFEDEVDDDDMLGIIGDMCCDEENYVPNEGVQEGSSDVDDFEMDRILTEIRKEEAEKDREKIKINAEDEMDLILQEMVNEETCLQNATEEGDEEMESILEAFVKEEETDNYNSLISDSSIHKNIVSDEICLQNASEEKDVEMESILEAFVKEEETDNDGADKLAVKRSDAVGKKSKRLINCNKKRYNLRTCKV